MGSICEDADDDVWMMHDLYYDVLEVEKVTMPNGATWLGTEDHSKWVRPLRTYMSVIKVLKSINFVGE
jgi:hypothetical protein